MSGKQSYVRKLGKLPGNSSYSWYRFWGHVKPRGYSCVTSTALSDKWTIVQH